MASLNFNSGKNFNATTITLLGFVWGYARGRGKIQDSNIIGIGKDSSASYDGVSLMDQVHLLKLLMTL